MMEKIERRGGHRKGGGRPKIDQEKSVTIHMSCPEGAKEAIRLMVRDFLVIYRERKKTASSLRKIKNIENGNGLH